MTEINDLRERVEAAEKRFGLIDEQQNHYSERVIGLIEAIEAQLADARGEIENQIAENRQLAEDNEELRSMLHTVLRSIEQKTFTQTLQNLEARVIALVETGDNQTKATAALTEGLAREEMSAEDLLAEDAAPGASEDRDQAGDAGETGDVEAAAAEAEDLGSAEAAGEAETMIEAAAEPAAETFDEMPGDEPAASEAEDPAAAMEPADEAALDEAIAEESVAGEDGIETAFTEEAVDEEAAGGEMTAEDGAAPDEDPFAEPETAAETAPDLDQDGAQNVDQDAGADPGMAEAPAEHDDDSSVHDLLAAMAELNASDIADAAILEANPEIAKLVEEARSLEAAAGSALDLTEPQAEDPAPDAAVMIEAEGGQSAMETAEAAETEVAGSEAAEAEAPAPAAEAAPTVKEIIRRVGALARELERAEAQRRNSQNAATDQATAEDGESDGPLDQAASA